jgi:hypothetical protein
VSANLIPGDVQQTTRIRRAAVIALIGVLALWAVLGIIQWAQLRTLDARVDERDGAAQRVALLQGQVDSLQVFQQMADDVTAGNEVLASAMSPEVSWAQLLVALSRGVPETASFTDINGQILDIPVTQAPRPDVFVDHEGDDIGFFTVSGYTTELFTPGVQDLLRRFGAIDGFFQEYLSNATIGEVSGIDVTTFAAEVRLDDRARTGRYEFGLPELGGP